MQKNIIISTPSHKLTLNCHFDFVERDKFEINKELFFNLCKSGCVNFDQNYSCPPFSPHFNSYVGKEKHFFVLLLKINLNQFKDYTYMDHHKLRIGNAVIKPRIEKIMRALELSFGPKLAGKFLGTGACRLCKPCQRKVNKKCRYPDKLRFSLESLGVDCNKLCLKLFKFPLLWYKEKKAPLYTSVIAAIPLNNINNKSEIIKLTKKELNKVL